MVLLLSAKTGFCQIQTPQPAGFQPVNISTPRPAGMPRYDNYPSVPFPSPNGQVNMGATAQDIINQTNRNNPYYRAPGDNRTIQQMNYDRIMQELQNDPAYNPRLRNGVSNNYPLDKRQELYNQLKDVYAFEDNRQLSTGVKTESYTSPEFAKKTKAYNDALKTLQDMLSGKRKLSVAQAYYTMESAYGESYLSQQEFNTILKQSADFIKTWMRQNNLDLNDNVAKHYAIQKFMSERLSITTAKQNGDKGQELKTITHDPFFYDYNDYTGGKDHRNFFVSKCLATGTGQCNSMPAVYLCLAETIGATAYLAHAPQHSLVKYPDNNGKIRNYEPTSNWDISDQWYLDDMFISRRAQQTGVYLSPMDSKQIVADCALQLAFGYHRKFGAADGKFETACINTAKPHFPQNNNITLYFTFSNIYGYQLGQILRRNGYTNFSDISKSEEATKLYQKWMDNENIIESLGYEENPPGLYEEMMKYHEFRGKVQEGYNISGKEKRSLFTKATK